jgi:hypothetical protein
MYSRSEDRGTLVTNLVRKREITFHKNMKNKPILWSQMSFLGAVEIRGDGNTSAFSSDQKKYDPGVG